MPRVPRVLQLAVESITRYGLERMRARTHTHTHKTDNKLGDLRCEVCAVNSRAVELRLIRTASGSHHYSSRSPLTCVVTPLHRMNEKYTAKLTEGKST